MKDMQKSCSVTVYDYKLRLKRNHERINTCNWNVFKKVQANMDIKYLLFSYNAINYLTKYVSKTETKSNAYTKCR